ncbi:MAG: sigma 54-interacting transcriptional regulator [Firmicutes bacterium]|nr:sigma 54-interacting transcriptional regulator [Bacillota bacterium]
MSLAKNSMLIIDEWRMFVEHGKKPKCIRPEILKSWERCKELQIDPYGGKSNIILTKDELNKKLGKNAIFIDIVKPFMDMLYQYIKSAGYSVFLTDNEGNILCVLANTEELKLAKEFNFIVGASWGEQAVGTTAVSMVIDEGIPVSFMSEEKYCFGLKTKACTAIPIKNNQDEMILILGVATDFPNPNRQIFGMLLAIKIAVENMLRMQNTTEELSIINQNYKKIFDSISDAVIVVDNRGFVKDINSKAKKILSVDCVNVIDRNIEEVMGFCPTILEKGQGIDGNKKFIIDFKKEKLGYSVRKVIPILGRDNIANGYASIIEKAKGQIDKKTEDTGKTKALSFENIIGNSKEIKEVIKIAEVAAKNSYNIIITGESGVGKDMFAQAIHNAGSRVNAPFIAINCGAIPENLIESELFGYEEGTFTGALKGGRQGKFEQASGGTIFFDEICEMPKNLQVKLLRVLQEKQIVRVGSSKPVPVDARIIAATNKDIEEEVYRGNFREDLYWRLNVIDIHIPSLAERKEDIPFLFEHFIEKHSGKQFKEYNTNRKVMEILKDYSWPGNVRELENIAQRLLAFSKNNTILYEHLPKYIKSKDIKTNSFAQKQSLKGLEKRVILDALYENNGNVTMTAKRLGLSRSTLYNKFKKYNINR